LKEEGLSEDEVKDSEELIQKLTDTFTKKVDELVAVKEVDIMKV
jgi:ribosome recycling factor